MTSRKPQPTTPPLLRLARACKWARVVALLEREAERAAAPKLRVYRPEGHNGDRR